MRKQIGLKLDEGLVGRLDERAGEVGQSRTAFIEQALETVLGWSPGTDPPGSVRAVPVVRPALRVVGSRGAVSSSDAKRNVSPRWRGGVEGSV